MSGNLTRAVHTAANTVPPSAQRGKQSTHLCTAFSVPAMIPDELPDDIRAIYDSSHKNNPLRIEVAPPPRATALFRKTRANFKKCYNFLMKKGGFPLTGLL